MGGFNWVRDMVEKYSTYSTTKEEKEEEVDKLGMACTVLYNTWCHALRKAKLHSINSVKVVVDYSDIINEQTLTRYCTRVDEMAFKEQITQKYIHGPDADVSSFPHAAVARTVKKKKKKFDYPETEEMTALQCFRGSNRDNIARDHAIELVTKMYDIHKKSLLTERQVEEVEFRFKKRRERLREAKAKREEKKREQRRLNYEAWEKKAS